MEDDLNILANGRRPQYVDKWKTTSIFWQMEDELIILTNGRQTQILFNHFLSMCLFLNLKFSLG